MGLRSQKNVYNDDVVAGSLSKSTQRLRVEPSRIHHPTGPLAAQVAPELHYY